MTIEQEIREWIDCLTEEQKGTDVRYHLLRCLENPENEFTHPIEEYISYIWNTKL